MDTIHRYSTANAGSRAHIAYWNSVLQNLLVPLKVTADDPHEFQAELMIGHFGSAVMADVRSSPACVDYDVKHIDQITEHFYSLQMVVEGHCTFRAFGRESEMGPGDIVLNDSHVPSQISFADSSRILSIRIDPQALGTYVPETEQFLGVPIRETHTMGRLLGQMLLGYWEQVGQGMPDEFAPTLQQSLLQVLASYFALEHARTFADASTSVLRRAAVKRYVEANLADPELAAPVIAKALGVSTRYIFRAFTGDDETLSTYIQRRRLEQVSIYLLSPLWAHWTVTRIAMHWGFTSVPHFSRLFRRHYGEAPGEYRRRHAA